MDTKVRLTVAVAALVSGLLSRPALAQTFSIMDAGHLGGGYSETAAVNARGQFAGSSYTAIGAFHAFLFDGSRMSDLGTLGGERSEGAAINNSGQVAGWSTTSDGTTHAFLHDGSRMRDLGTLGGGTSKAVAINASGQVVGWSTTRDGAIHAFFHDGSTMRDLGTLGGQNSMAVDLNDRGQVIGWSYTADGWIHAFLFDGTGMRSLNPPGGLGSEAYDINADGTVVGRYTLYHAVGGYVVTHAFVHDGDVARDLGTFGADFSEARAINDAGQVIGLADRTSSSDTHAFLFYGAVMRDLGTLGGAESEAMEVNVFGQILGRSDIPDAEGGGYQWCLWDRGRIINLDTPLLRAGYRRIDYYTFRLGDGGHIAGTADTASGETHALLLTPSAVTPIALEIRRSVEPSSNGLVQVALLSQPGTLKADQVVRESLTFGRSGEEHSLVACLAQPQDVNRDGLADLVCHFSTQTADLREGDSSAVLKGSLMDGGAIVGTGPLHTVPR